jgi:hypothetical protein
VVSAGQAVIATAEEAARFYSWPNLTYLPVRDAPPVSWALVWRTAIARQVMRGVIPRSGGHADR